MHAMNPRRRIVWLRVARDHCCMRRLAWTTAAPAGCAPGRMRTHVPVPSASTASSSALLHASAPAGRVEKL